MAIKRWYSIVSILLVVSCALTGFQRYASVSADAALALKLLRLVTEYKENPIGIDSRQPRFSWQIQTDRRGVTQSAYQIAVARSEKDLGGGSLVWDTGK